jgi:outer membrane protein OmpA-like peptidoglycan-associated protein
MYKALVTILCVACLSPARAQKATDTFRLYFDIGIPTLNHNAQKKVDLLIYNDKIINGSNILIVGYADFLGTERLNQNLSMRRARNVRDYLVKYGIDSGSVKLCVGKGEVERRGMTDRGGFPTDRRVDIVVNNKVRMEPPSHKRRDTGRKFITSLEQIKKMKPGTVFQLKNVYFPADRHYIKPESEETLEKLYTVLRDNPAVRISIEGHVCCIVDAPDALDIDTYEPTLSVNRAKAIYNYLVRKGIDPTRLRYAGFGKSRPIIEHEVTEEDAEKNRRVEIRILANDAP